jgi:hypothetical protein
MFTNYISARHVAQAAATMTRPETDTPAAQESFRAQVRAWNRQFGPVGFKVSLRPDEAGYREYQLYRWDWQNSREVIVGGGTARGSLEYVQGQARLEAATLELNP